MVFYILISIVFIAEIIIASSIISHLVKWDRVFIDTNEFLNDTKPKIKYIMKISVKISEQLTELAPYWVSKVQMFFINIMINNIKSVLVGLLFFSVKKKFKIKRIRGLKAIRLMRMFS